MEWTKEYCGVQHLGVVGSGRTRVTVERHTNCATLLEWYPGCKFSPREMDFEDVESAKQAGEAIVNDIKVAGS